VIYNIIEVHINEARSDKAVYDSSCGARNFVNWLKNKDMKRDKAIETMKEFPQEFELEELIERLVFVEKVEKGLQQIEKGKTVSHEKAKEISKKW
jgi:hypothetical protein